jgi:hypothetical protein
VNNTLTAFAPTPGTVYHHSMDISTTAGARRTEDIALDLLKFVAAHSNVSRANSASTPGFATPASATKPEDQVTQLLDLYARCRAAVEAPTKTK